MLTDQSFTQNDQDDRLRLYLVMSGLAGAALGIDPGSAPYDQAAAYGLYTPAGQHQVLSVTTGTAPQGQAAPVTVNVLGYSITVPMLLAIGVGAYLLLK